MPLKLPCVAQCRSQYAGKPDRFHVTCLWCRQRRKRELTKNISYGYLSMSKIATYGYQMDYEHHIIYRRVVLLPRYLIIDPAGHFTHLRCSIIVALDKLAAKIGLINCHPLANLFEFLANYPRW